MSLKCSQTPLNTTSTYNHILLNKVLQIIDLGVEKRDLPTLLGTPECRVNSILCSEQINHPKSLHDRVDLILKYFTPK